MYFTIVVIWALVVTSQALVPQIIDVMLDPQTWEASQQVWCPQSFTLVEFMATYYLPSIWSRVFKLKQVLQTRRQMYLWCSLQKPTCFLGWQPWFVLLIAFMQPWLQHQNLNPFSCSN